MLIIKGMALAQCVNPPVRVYANSQYTDIGLLTSVDNPANAADGNPATYSTINRLVGLPLVTLGTVTQYIKFGATVPAGTPVTIKVNFPTSLLSLLSGVEFQPFTGTNTAAGKVTSDASLLGLLNGAGDAEITILPQTSGGAAVPYDGVWIKLSGVAVLQSMNVYDAYYTQSTTASSACSVPVDVVAGVKAGTVVGGIANATGAVNDKYNAIDTDPTYATYAEMNVGAQVLSQVFHTTIFGSPSQVGDTIRMVLQKPGGGLLDLSVLNSFSIQPYNGTATAGTAISSSSSGLLSLSLLPGSTAGNEKYILTVVPTAVFDRVEVLMGGLATVGLVQGLRIYDVKRLIVNPKTNIDGVASASASVCTGSTSTLKVNNTQSCTTYNWYSAASGGTPLYTGDTYTPTAASLAMGANNFYVEANRTGCTEVNTRTKVTLTVNPLPTIAHSTNPVVCNGTTTAGLTYTTVTNTPTTYSIVWSAAAITAGFTNVTDAVLPATTIPITLPAAAPAATYNGTLYVKNANGCLSSGEPFSIQVDAKPTQPVINLTPQ